MSHDLSLDIAAEGERWARATPAESARRLEEMAVGSAAGRASDGRAMFACALWLLHRRAEDPCVALALQAAQAAGMRVAVLLLDDVAPRRVLSPRARRQHTGLRACDRLALSQPLRHRNAFLQPGLTGQLGLLNVHADRGFTFRLLARPGLELHHVVAMAARRPTTPEILTEIAASLRWAPHAEVREALVFNPFTPTAVAARYLPTLPVLRHVGSASALHHRLGELARALLSPGDPAAPQVRATRPSSSSSSR